MSVDLRPREVTSAVARKPTLGVVSVIIPCYQYARYLPACVESVLTQQEVDVQVLVIDDASSDGAFEVASGLAAGDDRVEVRRHSINRGHITTYNEGLRWAAGDYTVLLSADDLLVQGALSRAARLMNAHPEVGLVYGRSLFFQTNEALPKARTGEGRWEIWEGREWLERRCRAGHNCISSPEVVVRTKIQQKLGGYRSELTHAGDLEMWMRFAARVDIGYIAGADQAYYRNHPASMKRERFSAPLTELRQRKAAFDAVLDANRQILDNMPALSQMANRALAREALWRACRAYERGRPSNMPVEEMVAFALDAFPQARDLPEYRALRRRMRLGPRLAPMMQPLTAPAALRRRVRTWLWWQTWKTHGV
jgi:hypothetical protein